MPDRQAFALSFACHVLAMTALVMMRPTQRPEPAVSRPTYYIMPLVFLLPGAGQRGGGATEHRLQPPQRLEAPGRDAMSIPAQAPVLEAPPTVAPEPPPTPTLDIPATPLAASTTLAIGVLASPATASGSQGSGSTEGAGEGPDGGFGPGRGKGIDTGGTAHQIGNGVTPPLLIRSVQPKFTTEAMRARVSGVALLDCVVNPDGTVSNIRVVRSIDPRFGLDNEAIEAVRQWRFKPGTLRGAPVPVQVRVELAFALY